MTPERWEQIKTVFQEALERVPDHRGAYLDGACAGDEELRREVESLLSAREEAGSFIKAPAIELAAELRAEEDAKSEVGRNIGPYKVVRHLGAGGMGEVYLAEDDRLGRPVALKLLPSYLTQDEERVRRFRQEARAASALTHPNVATIYDVGETQGVSYIAMEYVEGQTLQDKIKGGPLEPAEIMDIGIQVADALEEAHSKGILHRDISSGNIMLTPRGRVKVLDFGLAKITGLEEAIRKRDTSPPAKTEPGLVMGTAPYMSPEQALGRAVDHRTDIFSLGSVLYEMITGRRPFAGTTTWEVLDQIIHTEPEAIGQSNRNSPANLEQIIRGCLEKDPQRRYQSARELRVDLKKLRPNSGAGEPIAARRGVRWGDVLVYRRRGLVAVTMLIIMVIAAAIYVRFLHGARFLGLSQIRSVAVLPLRSVGENPSEGEYLADGLSEALITKLTQLGNLRVTPWITAERYKNSTKTLQQLASEMQVEALITGNVRKAGNRIGVIVSLIDAKSGMQTWGDEFEEEMADILTAQRRIAIGAATGLRGNLTGHQEQTLAQAPSRNAEAYEHYLRGNAAQKQDKKELNDLAFDLFGKALKLDPNLAEAFVGLGQVQRSRYYYGWHSDLKDLDEAQANFQHALELNPALASAYGGLAQLYYLQGKSEECLKLTQKIARLGLEDVENLLALCSAYFYGGLGEKAISPAKRAVELDPANELAHRSLVNALTDAGRFNEGIEAGKTYKRRFGYTTQAYALAECHHCLGDFKTAKSEYEALINVFPDDFLQYLFLGFLYKQTGQVEEARETWIRGARVVHQMLAAYPRNPRMRTWLTVFYGYLGEREAVRREESVILKEWPNNGYLLMNLGHAHAALNEASQAALFFQRALHLGSLRRAGHACLESFAFDHLKESPAWQEYLKERDRTLNRLRAMY